MRMMQIYFWIQIHEKVTLNEIKRLELQILLLSAKI